MIDNFNVQPYDPIALAEIEVMANLMIAATEADRRLSQDQVDTALAQVEGAGLEAVSRGAAMQRP